VLDGIIRKLILKIFMASLLHRVRHTWLRSNAIFLGTVFAAAFVGEILVDDGIDWLWRWHNRGKLWADVEARLQREQSAQ
jgi:ubiquinol-cytochrome c reductase subunit 9